MIVLPYIDDIALEKQRDVVFVEFFKDDWDCVTNKPIDPTINYWGEHETRNKIIKWLEDNNIEFRETFSQYVPGLITQPYRGGLYIDVPYDENDPQFQKVSNFLEYEDGTSRFESVYFYYFLLSDAIKHEDRDYNQPDYNP